MAQGKKIIFTIRGYAILFLCMGLNTIGLLIGGWLYYREIFLRPKRTSSYPLINKVNPLSGNLAAYSELR